MKRVPVLLALLLATATPAAFATPAGGTTGSAAGPGATAAANPAPDPTVSTQAANNSTTFERIEADSSGLTIRLNLSMLTTMFSEGSVFRIVTGGSAMGQQVIWFDIGIAYTGGSVFSNPLSNFEVRAEMEMNFPSF